MPLEWATLTSAVMSTPFSTEAHGWVSKFKKERKTFVFVFFRRIFKDHYTEMLEVHKKLQVLLKPVYISKTDFLHKVLGRIYQRRLVKSNKYMVRK